MTTFHDTGPSYSDALKARHSAMTRPQPAVHRAPIPSEHAEAAALWQWAQAQAGARPPLRWLYHVPNEGKRRRGAAGRMAAEGLQSGVSDYVLPVPSGAYAGAYLELKRRDGGELARRNQFSTGLTANQDTWLRAMAEQGHAACVAWGWEAARSWLMAYLDLTPGRPLHIAKRSPYLGTEGEVLADVVLTPLPRRAFCFARSATECLVVEFGDDPQEVPIHGLRRSGKHAVIARARAQGGR